VKSRSEERAAPCASVLSLERQSGIKTTLWSRNRTATLLHRPGGAAPWGELSFRDRHRTPDPPSHAVPAWPRRPECPQRDSNPRYHLERVATWAASRWGRRAEDSCGPSYHPWPPGRLAQLVERLPYTQVAAGSSPAPPIFWIALFMRHLALARFHGGQPQPRRRNLGCPRRGCAAWVVTKAGIHAPCRGQRAGGGWLNAVV
jgi:hypothetical protein